MSLEESNREIQHIKSYQVDLKNPVAISKVSEKEKEIKPRIDFNNDKSIKEEDKKGKERKMIKEVLKNEKLLYLIIYFF